MAGKRGGKISPATEFKPGVSGNPNGRPKKIPAIDELLADVLGAQEDGKSAAKQIIEALAVKARKGDVRAAEVLLERMYGKVKQDLGLEPIGELLTGFKIISASDKRAGGK